MITLSDMPAIRGNPVLIAEDVANNRKGGRIKAGRRSTIRIFEMTGAEFYRMVQTVAHYEEKFAKVVNAEDFNGGKEYTLFGFDISSDSAT